MLRNYFNIAVRNLVRNKVFSTINILGLAMGIASCLLLVLYVVDEAGYDKHHQRSEDIYRVVTSFDGNLTGLSKLASTSPPIALGLKNEIPEIESATRVLSGVTQSLIRNGADLFYETDGCLADSTLFDVLSYDLKEGNPKTALTHANTVVLSERLAHKLFGNEPALDRHIEINQGGKFFEYRITGVFYDKHKSIVKANFFTSMTSKGLGEYIIKDPEAANQWAGQNFVPAYLKLVPGHVQSDVERKMNAVLVKYGSEQLKALGISKHLSLELLRDVYLKSDVGQSPRIINLYVVITIAVFILLIACINFMNLSTAKATKRAAEIGIRKTLGALRSALIVQIVGEAMTIVFISIFLGILIVMIALPYFNSVTGKTISLEQNNVMYLTLGSLLLTMVTGLLAGSYPAFHISSFQPAEVLKGKLRATAASGLFRHVLVVFQFVIAIVLTCGILVITTQLDFTMERNLGFDYQAKIVLPLRTDEASHKYDAIKKELLNRGLAREVSATNFTPGMEVWNDMMFYPDGGTMETAVDIRRNSIDIGFMELLDMKLATGRMFTDNRAMEKNNLILNKSATLKLGFDPESIIGQNLHFDWEGKKYDFRVIGVMEDFHQTSLHDQIVPTLFELADSTHRYNYLIASVATTDFARTVSDVESLWKSQIVGTPFEYSFLDEAINKQYDEDRKLSAIITSFATIALVISCLGLYGLSAYMAERRFKEIGIRKVMGASVSHIVRMMSFEFTKLVLIAFVIAVPVAMYTMNKWLESFAYRVELSVSVFAFAGGIALTVALFTVSFESIKSALTNPVESLRME